ncbi:nuclear protein qri2 [Moniliophthora roreri MCA 2997]|uniref:Non-structural maintenance of chromosomes element 4 n=1 Tax=Moniliophthora roreri (strain MCA 2997) TaxID=1381753 RepID=V2Y3L7_MONRO|nr:nuclear protein qri2 [Moniliophthora roreri MCA 2997]
MSDVEMNDAELVYDPDQDPDEKRAVRRGYREFDKRFEGNTQRTTEWLIEGVKQSNDLFKQVKNPGEATLDSNILVRLTTSAHQNARNLKSGSGSFDVDDFLSKLFTLMGGHRKDKRNPNSSDNEDEGNSALDWAMMGRNALAKSRRVPMVSFMLGPLSIEQKKRVTVKRAKLEKNDVDAKKPQEIKEEDISRAENETTKNVSIIANKLDELGKINLFRFFINPKDFAQSVENLFYLSFLIRDGKVAVSLDDEDSEESGEPKPVIYLCSPPSDEDYKLGIRKSQSVFEFDMPTWKRAIEVFDLKDPIIPHREKTEMHMRIGNKWYG